MRTIDIAAVPRRLLFDTGVVIRALGQRPNDKNAPACRDLFAAILASPAHKVLVAAPTIAEIVRGTNPLKLPSTRSVVVVAFDRRAANLLGEKVPHRIVRARQGQAPADYWRYDALIVACALSAKAEGVVAADEGVRELAIEMGMPKTKVFEPDDLWAAQRGLDL